MRALSERKHSSVADPLHSAPGQSETNLVELAASLAPRPLLLISCGWSASGRIADPTSTFRQDSWPFISKAYRVPGAPDAVHHVHLADESHDYAPTKRDATYAFFAERLGLGLRAENLRAIAIESPVELTVFDAEHPLSPYALCGPKEAAEAFGTLIHRDK